jgi:hypothetical protein
MSREFITLLGGAVAWPLAVRGQASVRRGSGLLRHVRACARHGVLHNFASEEA